MIFSSENAIKPIYFLPKDDLVRNVLVPAFQEAERVDCMMGFFSSEALSALAPGLATFLNQSKENLRLIVSPFLKQQDRDAIEAGIKSREEAVDDFFAEMLVSEDTIKEHTLKCLTHLIHSGRLDMKIALMGKALFHPKVWLFHRSDRVLGVHGSSNMTAMGIQRNFEQISVAQSWQDPNQKNITFSLNDQFQRLWNELEDDCIVMPVSRAIREKLLKEYLSDKPPTEDDFFKAYKKIEDSPIVIETPSVYEKPAFVIPCWLEYQSGAFLHQGKAVDAWCEAGNRGVLEMATGAGKTITAMICAHRLYEQSKPLMIVVAAPYLPLIEQWCGEIEIFGLKPTNMTKISGARSRSKTLQKLRRRLKSGLSDVEVIVVSHDTLCSSEFHDCLSKLETPKMLIADEAHNLGRLQFIGNTPDYFEYRLALSATPERQYDADGTEALFDFFGPVVFQFTLQEAIGTCLVEYDYYVHPVYLTEEEMDDWYDLTQRIRSNAWRSDKGTPDDFLAKLFRDRRKLLETAKNKLTSLAKLLDDEDHKTLKYVLIYATDKDPEQLSEVNRLLQDRNILYHQLTAEETRQRERCQKIIQSFQGAEIQVLTAKRVLDEGVNIPQINKAFILASTTVERQWVQRRGRLLRTCKETNKTHSEIHDFLALPPNFENDLDEDARGLIKSELRRIQAFASAARNAGKADGPLPLIDKMVNSIFV